MSLDLFDTRTMLAALEQRVPPKTFLKDRFFNRVNISLTDSIDIDIWKGKRKLAPFVNPQLAGKIREKQGYKTRTYKAPYIKSIMVTTAEDILKRTMGNTIYGNNISPAERAAQEVGKNLATLEEDIIRREEWMCAQVLTTGKVRVIGEGVNDEIDFLMDADNLPVLTGTALWSDHTNSTPITNLKTWKRIATRKSGISPVDCIMDITAYDHFMKNTKEVIGAGKLFDLQRINVGQIEPRDLGNGVSYIGRINEIGLDIWTYEEWYVDDFDNETEKPLIPVGKVLLGNPAAYTQMQYCAIHDLDCMNAVARFPKSWREENPSQRLVMVQSAPLPCLHQPDAFVCATVL